MASITSQLIVSLLDRVTGPAKRVAQSMRGLNRVIKEAAAGPVALSDRLNAAITRNDRALEAARGKMLDSVATLYILQRALTAPVQAAQEFDRALAEIGAKGNLTAEQMTAIGEAAKKTSGDMNQFALDVVRAQDFLIGMGLDVERSTKAMPTIARAATATGASLVDLSKAGFAAMSNLGVAAEDLGKSFDIMAAAGKAGGFELRDMAQYLPSITALASAKGMTGQDGLTQIAAALQIVRRGAGDASEAATNFNNILQKINSNDSIKNFAKFGIDIQKVLKDAKANGTDPLEASLRAINTALGGDMSRLGELFADAQVQKGLIPLLTGIEDYIRLRDQAARADGVVNADFARMMQTGVEQMKAFQIAMQNFATGVGAALIPALGSIAGALTPVLDALTGLVNAHPQVAGALIAITAGFVGLRAAMAGIAFIGLMGKGGVLAMSSAVLGMVNPLKLATGAAVAFRAALMMTGVGAVLVGIALAGKFIYDNWTGITAAAKAFGEAFMAALGPVRPMLDPVVSALAAVFDWITKVNFEISPERWAEWGAAAGEAIGEVVRWFAELPGRIAAVIGSIDLTNIIKWPSLPAWMKGGPGDGVTTDPMGTGVDGMRAKGGPISRGASYLVGERGPELITAGRSGYVNKTGTAGAGGGVTVNQSMSFTITGSADENVIDKIRKVMRDEVRETFRGVFADTGLRIA